MNTAASSPEHLSKSKLNERASILIKKCDDVICSAVRDLDEARAQVEPFGLSVDSSILDPTFGCLDFAVLRTTGGHSNTDHVVKITGDPRKDRVEELKRSYQRRAKSMQPESRGDERWDKPKIPGERRRRISREKDLPQAPPEPPTSGYVAFVSQMTTKIRHDRPNQPHNQTKVVQEISQIWKYGFNDDEREYYNEFCRRAREEYQRLHDEYRATGRFEPAKIYERMEGVGPWVHKNPIEKNELERELATYETVKFPVRPPEMDEEYNRRQQESIKRRKLKLKAETLSKRRKMNPERETTETSPLQNFPNEKSPSPPQSKNAASQKEVGNSN
mmetsp:Transcript_13744/g.20943  ORF Transcript_13744/g.20943 Transcript_13744/m.20943 type:complete len:332 (-) Transcript_13744:932-1927(-)